MDNDQNILKCRVCGFKQEDPPWGVDGKSPTFDFCPCCGVEFGYEDCQLSAIRIFRKKWLEGGSLWSEPQKKPIRWYLEEQLRDIPIEFK